MRKIFLLVILFMLLFLAKGFSQDNIYGDFLISSFDKKVSLDLESAQLVDVLKMLSQQIGLNFVSTEAVRDRSLTLYPEGVPLKEAMDIIFKANNLDYDFYPESNIFVVKEMGKPSIELKTKIYNLKYARIKSSKVETELKAKMKPEDEEDEEDTGVEEVGIKSAVQNVLSESGRVTEDPITNSLIVVDVPAQFPIIDEVVAMLDVPIPKVMIEVEMLDVSKRTIDSLGVNWPQAIAALDMTLTQRATSFPFGDSRMGNNSGNDSTILMGDATPSGWSNVSWGTNHFGPTILTVVGAELVLNFLRTQTDTKFLARPKILTLSNQTAEIRITTDEAIGITKTESETGDITFDIDRAETGTKLRVTPQVDGSGGDITLFVEMVVKEAKDSGFAATSASFITGDIKDPEERSATAIMRLKDGQTLFVGGLIKTEVSDTNTKVPILGDIPILGRLFRHKSKDVQERELLVFLTPHVIQEVESCITNKAKILPREQLNSVKKESVSVALDKFSK